MRRIKYEEITPSQLTLSIRPPARPTGPRTETPESQAAQRRRRQLARLTQKRQTRDILDTGGEQ